MDAFITEKVLIVIFFIIFIILKIEKLKYLGFNDKNQPLKFKS